MGEIVRAELARVEPARRTAASSNPSISSAQQFLLTGPVVATVAPFDRRGRVDTGALGDYLAFLAQAGVSNLVVNGTTGEFTALTFQERVRVAGFTRKHFAAAGTLIVHVSSCSVPETLRYIERAADIADALLLLPPFYFAQAEEPGLELFFAEVLGSQALARCGLPVFLYNFPRHTQNPISPALLARLAARFGNVAGIKDSGGDLAVSQEYKQAADGLQVFIGSDRDALAVLQRGLDGSVTGGGNPAPERLVALWQAFRSGDMPAAARWQQAFDEWTTLRESLPASEIARGQGGVAGAPARISRHVRPPLVQVAPELQQRVAQALAGQETGNR
jgi:4-hydroxy-tetrahydrodipicolinate synthase